MQHASHAAHSGMHPYRKFVFMMVFSFVVMYALMFFNVADMGHILLSKMRTYMALLMTSAMALFMLPIMGSMYPNKRTNAALLTGAALVFGLSFAAIRTQAFITDVDYMEGMIPHHSSAIMTSSHAHLSDPQTRQLAKDIVAAQEREIALMKDYIRRIKNQ